MAKKIRLTVAMRTVLQERADDLVQPVELKAAMDARREELFALLTAVVDKTVNNRQRAVLKELRCLERPDSLIIAAGAPYNGLKRDVIQFKYEGSGDFTGREVVAVRLNTELNKSPEFTTVPTSMLSTAYVAEIGAYWDRRFNDALVVYTLADSPLRSAAKMFEEAVKAYEEERKTRLEVYGRLIKGTRYFEDLVERWPEVQGLYLEEKVKRAVLLPATLSVADHEILLQDMKERRTAEKTE